MFLGERESKKPYNLRHLPLGGMTSLQKNKEKKEKKENFLFSESLSKKLRRKGSEGSIKELKRRGRGRTASEDPTIPPTSSKVESMHKETY